MREEDKYLGLMKRLGLTWYKMEQVNDVPAATGPGRRFTWIWTKDVTLFFNEMECKPHTEEELQRWAKRQMKETRNG